jgi:uncharacterized protein (DUF4415 family)
MAGKKTTVFDDDNPEWTAEDFARARPISDFPELAAAFPKAKGGRPRGSNKQAVSLRLDRDVLQKFKSTGRGWQSRINDVLRRARV